MKSWKDGKKGRRDGPWYTQPAHSCGSATPAARYFSNMQRNAVARKQSKDSKQAGIALCVLFGMYVCIWAELWPRHARTSSIGSCTDEQSLSSQCACGPARICSSTWQYGRETQQSMTGSYWSTPCPYPDPHRAGFTERIFSACGAERLARAQRSRPRAQVQRLVEIEPDRSRRDKPAKSRVGGVQTAVCPLLKRTGWLERLFGQAGRTAYPPE